MIIPTNPDAQLVERSLWWEPWLQIAAVLAVGLQKSQNVQELPGTGWVPMWRRCVTCGAGTRTVVPWWMLP